MSGLTGQATFRVRPPGQLSYGTYYLQYDHRAIPPVGQSRSDLRLAQELGTPMGLTDLVLRLYSEPEYTHASGLTISVLSVSRKS
jgi:hypothetical protein